MAAAIATEIIADSGVVDVMKNYIFSRAKEEFKSVWYLKDEIKRMVETIKRMDEDAEKKQLQNEDVRKWVSDRKNAGYDMEDVLDDYRVMVSTEDGQGVVTRWMGLAKDGLYLVCRIPFSCCLEIIPAPVTPRIEIAHRVRSIRKNLDEINQRKANLSLVRHSGGGSSESDATTSRDTSSLEDRQRPMIGRNEWKTKIKEALLNSFRASTSQLSIVCIVGAGGMGKTTLAQNIFNDEDVKAAFSFMKWLYVGPDKFDCQGLLNKVIRNSGQHDVLDDLHSNVAGKIEKESFLIVLDDAWLTNDKEWERFLTPLSHVDKGGAIIVTSRNSAVGTAIPYGNTLYELPRMSDKECMAIFERCAFKGQEAETYPHLKRLSEQVVQKLKGVPLAASILGGFLHKHLQDRQKWINIVEAGWPHAEKDNVVEGVVGLSYLHLPSRLKPCFAYCAMFPKGFGFDKETTVRMWIAQGYVEKPRGNELMEHIGSDYFIELCQRSFLQTFDGDRYIMHDLIHDFALKVFTEGLQVGASNTEDGASPEEIRHLSVYYNRTEPQELKSLHDFKKLRTLMIESDVTIAAPPTDVFAKFRYLRLLVLDVYGQSEFPDSIRHLQFLQYLDISRTSISTLPEPVCDLVNLLFLNLPYPCALPEGMNKLVKLRFIKVGGAGVPQFKGIGQLTSLQVQLDTFKVENKSGWKISELGGLNHLHGKLVVRGLQNVTGKEEAKQAHLEKKVHLEELVLDWTVLSSVQQEHVVEGEVLEGLLPPTYLKVLEIRKNRGARIPSWMEEHGNCPIIFSSLVTLELDGCCNWECLPTLGQLRSLQFLTITKADHVKKIGPEFYGETDAGVYFPRLRYFSLGEMSSWEEWEIPAGEMEGGGRPSHLFPSLQWLVISQCPKLPSLSPVLRHLTSLESIAIWRCDELASLEEEGDDECGWTLPSLEKLSIEECPKLASLSPILRHSSNLKSIEIKKCAELSFLEEEGDDERGWMLPSLEELSIEECPKLASLSPILSHSSNLKSIEIKKCAELASVLSEEGDGECGWMFPCSKTIERLIIEDCSPKLLLSSLSQMFTHLTALDYLNIRGFHNLQCLPPSIHNLCSLRRLFITDCPAIECLPDGDLPPSLRELWISGCPLLKGSCREGGPDRPKIPTSTRVFLPQEMTDDDDDAATSSGGSTAGD